MPPKRSRSVTNLSINTTTTFISDPWTSHIFLAPTEYSSDTIGIHSCLVRCCEYEHFANTLYQGAIIGLQTKDFIHRLDDMEKKLKDDSQLNIERCAMITRLRQYLEQNGELFQKILKQIENHLDGCMRDDLLTVFPRTYDELTQKYRERNQLALKHDLAHRMRRFQFHNHNEANQPVNLINLQNMSLPHFQLLVQNIKPDAPNRAQLLTELKDLLDNSFFIIKHPSPPIATCSPPKNEDVTAKVNCRLLCLLDRSNSAITIENTTPFVCYLSKLNQMKELDVSYRQPEMDWKTYSIVTTSKSHKIFSCADLSEIVLNQISASSQREQPSKGKIRYAPYVYRIDFHINLTIDFPNDPTPYQHCVIVQSAPFGLTTNTSQSPELFAEVFLEDLKDWKSLSTKLNTTTSPSTIPNLTIIDIVDSIRRYFIHKTGIEPKFWVIRHIQKELIAVCQNNQNSMDSFHNVLFKILAQIDFMAEHPLLIFFHNDGLFFGICNSQQISEILRKARNSCEKSVCAIRFGSIQHMSKAKNIGIRIDFVGKSSDDHQQYTFETAKLSMELGLFIIKIALSEASRFENILYNNTKNSQNPFEIISTNLDIFVKLYDSKKLRELCPHEQQYPSIWTSFYNKENNNSNNSSLSSTGACANTEAPYYLCNTNICPINQTQQVMQSPQLLYPQQQQYSQLCNSQPLQPQYYSQSQVPIQVEQSYASFSNVAQASVETAFIPQNNQQNINSTPVIFVITPSNQFTMSPECIAQIISYHYPEYSSLIQSNRIHHLSLNLPSELPNTSMQISKDFLPNLQSTYTTDPMNFLESDIHN